jgi:hypothetical protein
LGELILMGEGRSVQLQHLWDIRRTPSFSDLWAPAKPPGGDRWAAAAKS